ncbi:MAG: response regulator transcription factor [Alphaproteobacteria bacterium]|nr:response regulator transcription factor [Alphaproteobacteria bacterium]
MRILLVEDDDILGAAVRDQIAADGHAVDWFQRLDESDDALSTTQYDLILLDLNLPDGLGLTFLTTLRRRGSSVPVIILTARDQLSDRLSGLNAGADDYLVKPFDLSELSARIAAVSRRYTGNPNPLMEFGDLEIDIATKRIFKQGLSVDLTAREWALLSCLLQSPSATISKSRLEDALYAFGAEVESNAVEVYVSRLRKKLGHDIIHTIRGLGYRMKG